VEFYLGKTGLVMEAVVLAAGKGQRMEGFAKLFFKPLLEINGMPLIAYAVEYASAAGATKVTVVAAKSNIEDIEQALKMYASWVTTIVQHEPTGPGDAALIGLENTVDKSVMLLMSDNIMNSNAVSMMATRAVIEDIDAVGVLHVPISKAGRFTRIRRGTNGALKYVESVEVSHLDETGPGVATVWCGPLIFKRDTAINVLRREKINAVKDAKEFKIGPYLNEIMRKGALLVDVGAMDVGIPAEYTQQIEKSND
jgi:choline kinase